MKKIVLLLFAIICLTACNNTRVPPPYGASIIGSTLAYDVYKVNDTIIVAIPTGQVSKSHEVKIFNLKKDSVEL